MTGGSCSIEADLSFSWFRSAGRRVRTPHAQYDDAMVWTRMTPHIIVSQDPDIDLRVDIPILTKKQEDYRFTGFHRARSQILSWKWRLTSELPFQDGKMIVDRARDTNSH